MLEATKWIGTAAGIIGAAVIALNLNVNQYGYALFLVSSALWAVVAVIQREASLCLLQLTFTTINVVGLWRYSGVVGGG